MAGDVQDESGQPPDDVLRLLFIQQLAVPRPRDDVYPGLDPHDRSYRQLSV